MPRKLEILVIDDEPIVGKRLRTALEKDGHSVEVHEKGREAVERIRAKTFDIVVSDVRIDEIDGLDVLRAAQGRSSHTRTIMITGYATVELAREALAKGAFDFLAKPFRPKDLRKLIEKAAQDIEAEAG
jgi:DNA-binding NtrC family response regulator